MHCLAKQLPRGPRCRSGRRDHTGGDGSGLSVVGRHWDIYASEKRLKSALKALSESDVLPENKELIVRYCNSMKARGIKAIRLKKTVYMLRDLARILGQNFENASKEDIERVLCSLEERGYSEWTKADYRIILKRFYKWLLGEDEYYPRIVSWIRNKEPKNGILPEELITEAEVKKLVRTAKYIRNKSFIYVLYESGARIGEMLTLRIKNVTFGDRISSIQVAGKTGQRRIPIVNSAPFLKRWLARHPLRKFPDALVWIKMDERKGDFRKQGNREVYRELCYSSVKKILQTTFQKAKVNKPCNPHQFRHSRATHLANHLTEAQLKQFFGWTQSSDMAGRYVHLSGRDVDEAILKIYHLKQERKGE